jgi:hypothetical protein
MRDIRIPDPCSVSWDSMREDGAARRYCSRCRISVIDLSAMTERQAKRLLARTPGPLCISYRMNQDGRVLFAAPARRSLPLHVAMGVAVTVAACRAQGDDLAASEHRPIPARHASMPSAGTATEATPATAPAITPVTAPLSTAASPNLGRSVASKVREIASGVDSLSSPMSSDSSRSAKSAQPVSPARPSRQHPGNIRVAGRF